MKRFSILVASALVMGLSFTSCSSDDDSNDASIVGKWNFESFKYTSGGVSETEPYDDHEPGCAKDYLEFFADGSAVAGDYVEDCVLIPDPATYTVSGNVLTVNASGDVSSQEIIELNSTTLVLRSVETIGGVIETTDVTLKKG